MHYLPTATSTFLFWQDNGRHDRLKTNNGRRQPLPPYLNKKGFYYYFWPKNIRKAMKIFFSFPDKLKQGLMDESFKIIICYRCGLLIFTSISEAVWKLTFFSGLWINNLALFLCPCVCYTQCKWKNFVEWSITSNSV